jgi:hypothetical protein
VTGGWGGEGWGGQIRRSKGGVGLFPYSGVFPSRVFPTGTEEQSYSLHQPKRELHNVLEAGAEGQGHPARRLGVLLAALEDALRQPPVVFRQLLLLLNPGLEKTRFFF